MSKEISRRFDLQSGQCTIVIEDEDKSVSVHTINLLEPDGSEADVKGIVAKRLQEAKERQEKIRRVAEKHGY